MVKKVDEKELDKIISAKAKQVLMEFVKVLGEGLPENERPYLHQTGSTNNNSGEVLHISFTLRYPKPNNEVL